MIFIETTLSNRSLMIFGALSTVAVFLIIFLIVIRYKGVSFKKQKH